MINLINLLVKCIIYLNDNKSKDIMNYCIIEICNLFEFDYGFIGEKIINDKNDILFNYLGTKGFEKIDCLNKINNLIEIARNTIHYDLLETGKNIIINEENKDHNLILPKNHPDMKEIYCIPLKNKDNIIGIMGLGNKDNKEDYTKKEYININLLEYVGIYIAHLLINIKNINEIENNKLYFISNMSHEIRTPLNSIISLLDLILKDKTKTKEEIVKHAERMKICSKQLLSIVNNILDYSKIINDGLKLKTESISLLQLLNDVYYILIEQINEKKIDFKFK